MATLPPTVGAKNPYGPFFPWKTLLYGDKCRAILRGEFPPPVTIHIYLTNRCNNRCGFCIMRRERATNPGDLSTDVVWDIARYAQANGVGAIHVSGGGEPLLWDGNWDALGAFAGPLVLSTNGRLLTPDLARRFRRIRVSLNAGCPGTYQKLTGADGTAWDALLARLARVCGDSGRPAGQEIGLGFVATPENWREITLAVRLAQELGMDFVHIRPAYYPPGTPEDAEIRRLSLAIYHLCEACEGDSNGVAVYGTAEKFAGYWTKRGYTHCRASPLHAVVAADGRFLVCQDVFIRFGDLNTQGFSAAWDSAEHRAALAEIDLDNCPRCVMGRANEIIERVFMRDEILAGLL